MDGFQLSDSFIFQNLLELFVIGIPIADAERENSAVLQANGIAFLSVPTDCTSCFTDGVCARFVYQLVSLNLLPVDFSAKQPKALYHYFRVGNSDLLGVHIKRMDNRTGDKEDGEDEIG